MAARCDCSRGEHSGGMAAQIFADGAPPGQALHELELRLGHVHVVPARLRHRRAHQVRAPDLVAGSRQVRAHDHRSPLLLLVPVGFLSLICTVVSTPLFRFFQNSKILQDFPLY